MKIDTDLDGLKCLHCTKATNEIDREKLHEQIIVWYKCPHCGHVSVELEKTPKKGELK